MNWLTQILTAFGKPFQWWVIVAPWEQGLRVRGGKGRMRLEPGVHFRIPFWDRVYVQSVRRRPVVNMNQLMMSRDHKTFCVSFKVEFGIDDIEKLYQATSNPELIVDQRAAAAFVAWGIQHDAAEIDPAALAEEATRVITPLKEWGLSGLEVELTGFASLRTYRLVMNDYRHGAGLYDLDAGNNGQR